MFNIPISTIRFYMARKGILPRRKRGRTAILPYVHQRLHLQALCRTPISFQQPVSTYSNVVEVVLQAQQNC
ncbi:hypothetical protein quinque_013675 [Culex quinquefasciatus]